MAMIYPDGGYPVYYWPGYYWPEIGVSIRTLRQQILDAIKSALESSVDIEHVTDKKEQWWSWGQNKFPGVCIVCGDEEDTRFAFLGAMDAKDMQSRMRVNVIGYVFDKNNDLGDKRSDLINAIETAITNDSTVTSLVGDIVLTKVQTDKGELENFSLVNCEFGLDYLYSMANP